MNEGKACASGFVLSAVLDVAIAEYKNCLSQNQKLFVTFWLQKVKERRKNVSFSSRKKKRERSWLQKVNKKRKRKIKENPDNSIIGVK